MPKDEDNPTSLAVGPRNKKDGSVTVFAGVNSGPDDIKKGKNQTFRVLAVKGSAPSAAAKAKKSGEKSPSVVELTRDSLFVHKDGDTYQRLLRLTPLFEAQPQLGAAATGFSRVPQIALFDVPPSGAARWNFWGTLDIAKEAMDLDVVQKTTDTYELAYCDDHDLFTVEVNKEKISDAKCVYSLTPEEGSSARPSFRSLRYLTPGFLVAVVNKPASGGVSIQGYRLPSEDQETARLAIQKSLPSSVTKATGLAVRNLSPPSSPTEKQDNAQFVIAVAGNDSSISLYTMEHKNTLDVGLLANLAPFKVIKAAHPSNITSLTFSPFNPPAAVQKPEHISVKLASVAVGFTTVIHNIPLKSHTDKSLPAPKEGSPKPPRYIVALKSRGESPVTVITVLTVVILIMAFIGQTFMEAKSITTPVLGIKEYLPKSWTTPLLKDIGRIVDSDVNTEPVPQATTDADATLNSNNIEGLLADARKPSEGEDAQQRVVIKHHDDASTGSEGLPDLHVGLHDEEAHGPATPWEELPDRERELWKARLKKTGHWVEDMGETIFRGVLFGEIGGAIGNIIGEAM